MDIKTALALIADRKDLKLEQMRAVMQQIMGGEASDAQIGAFLMGMRLKGESLDEITAAAMVMRELVTVVPISGDHLVDIVGTGGDAANLFNVSTAASFVVAAGGGQVAKHGNRSVSSSSGSADLLEAAGIRLDLSPTQIVHCVNVAGVGFMFAPAHHSAMRHAIGPRRELGVRTIFNILGPMTNPAAVRRILIGVYDEGLCRLLAQVLNRLGAEHAMIVHAKDGLDEISCASTTFVAESRDGEFVEYTITPEDLGLERCSLQPLVVDSAAASLALIRAALTGSPGERADSARTMIALNAGAGLYVAGIEDTIKAGVEIAVELIGSGAAWNKLSELVEVSSAFQ